MVSSDHCSISLHELEPGPPPQLRLLVQLASPGLDREHHKGAVNSFTWASDGSAALIGLSMNACYPPSPDNDTIEAHGAATYQGTDLQVGTYAAAVTSSLAIA